jgi:hypothetical protein
MNMHKIFFAGLLLIACPSAFCQDIPADLKEKVDAIIVTAYKSAAEGFPCKMKGQGKYKILSWKKVDRCLNDAADNVDWAALSEQLQNLKSSFRDLSRNNLYGAATASLAAHALHYNEIFDLKDTGVRLPLTNSVLKFLPDGSLQDLPVFQKDGNKVGTFAGVYYYEFGGGSKLTLFQFVASDGKMQSAASKLLLDSYNVPLKDAFGRPGFRLAVDKLLPKY